MDPNDLENINLLLERDTTLREKIKEQVADLDKKMRTMVGMLNKIHSTRSESLSEILGLKDEWSDRLALPVEDYLHGLISLVNELVRPASFHVNPSSFNYAQSRLAVNAVTLGNFEEPIRISIFVKDIFTGFSMAGSSFYPLFLRN
ncbi:hypothetical protein H0H81_002865 [Sphagnurus paluster]|uniref:Uncharacterized protein n=1 Tax=Sphagnurus paluster TaxID=117069 RepID=A0A9P7GLP2_9AGAR|nr:hypothetical protein H0H81_002865 [Sphagnurus paluster]